MRLFFKYFNSRRFTNNCFEALYIGIPCVLSPIQAHYQLNDNMSYSYIADDFEYGSFVNKIDEALSVDLTKDEIIELRRSD